MSEREAQSLSREDLAYKSGVNVKTIKRIEHREHDPRPSTVRRLAEGLGISPEALRPDPAVEVDRLERLEATVERMEKLLQGLALADAEVLAEIGKVQSALGAQSSKQRRGGQRKAGRRNG